MDETAETMSIMCRVPSGTSSENIIFYPRIPITKPRNRRELRKFYAGVAESKEPFAWICSRESLILVPGEGKKMITSLLIFDKLVAECGESFVRRYFRFLDGISYFAAQYFESCVDLVELTSKSSIQVITRQTKRNLINIRLHLLNGAHDMVHYHAKGNIRMTRKVPMTAELYRTIIKTWYYRVVSAKQAERVFISINCYRALLKFRKEKAPTKMDCDELAIYYHALGDIKKYFISRLKKMHLSVDLRSNIYKYNEENWSFTMQGNKKLMKYPDGKIKKKVRSLRYKSCLYCQQIVWKRKKKGKKQEKNRRCSSCGSWYCSKYCQKRAWNYCIDLCKKYNTA